MRLRPNWSRTVEPEASPPLRCCCPRNHGGPLRSAGRLVALDSREQLDDGLADLVGSAPSFWSTWAATPSPSRIRPRRMLGADVVVAELQGLRSDNSRTFLAR